VTVTSTRMIFGLLNISISMRLRLHDVSKTKLQGHGTTTEW